MSLLAEAWLHNLDPFAIEIPWFPGGGIRWYGLSYLAGFFIGFLLIRRVLTVGVSPLKPVQAADLVVTIAIAIVIGGRLGYVLFYKPELFIEFTPDSAPWWGVLKINNGGMASHGGMLGGIGGCLFFAWRYKTRPAHLFDLMAFGAPLGLLMGRIANFVNGELYGRQCDPDFALAVQFPQEIGESWDSNQLADLARFANEQNLYYRGQYELIEKVIQKAQAGDPAWCEYLQQTLTARYPSQLFAGVTEGIIVFAVLLWLYRKPVKAGLIGGWFCATYALMRVVNEFFRLPDAHLIADESHLPTITRGQWLSIGLFVLGVTTIVVALRSKKEKLGGWMRGGDSATDEHG